MQNCTLVFSYLNQSAAHRTDYTLRKAEEVLVLQTSQNQWLFVVGCGAEIIPLSWSLSCCLMLRGEEVVEQV